MGSDISSGGGGGGSGGAQCMSCNRSSAVPNGSGHQSASLCRPVTGTIFLVLESGDSGGGGGDGSNSIGGGGGVAVAVAVTVGRRCTVTPYSRQTDS